MKTKILSQFLAEWHALEKEARAGQKKESAAVVAETTQPQIKTVDDNGKSQTII